MNDIIKNYIDLIIENVGEYKTSQSWYDYDEVLKRTPESFEELRLILIEKGIKSRLKSDYDSGIINCPYPKILEILIPDTRVKTIDIDNIIESVFCYNPAVEILEMRDKVFKMTEDEYLVWRMSI